MALPNYFPRTNHARHASLRRDMQGKAGQVSEKRLLPTISCKSHDCSYNCTASRIETINKHQFMVSHVAAWKKSADVQAASAEVGKATDHTVTTYDYYEDKGILESYDKFHFGAGLLAQECFPVAIAQVCLAAAKKVGVSFDSAMDAGGGPGRSAFEFVKEFKHVESYDYSHGFIESLNKHKSDFLNDD